METGGPIYNDAALQEAFNTVDKSGDGQIDWGELSAAIKAMDPKRPTSARALPVHNSSRARAAIPVIEDMMSFADKDGDGKVSSRSSRRSSARPRAT